MDQLRRLLRIARILGRVVEDVLQLDPRALRQRLRGYVPVHVLPAVVPVLDVDERRRRAVRQRRGALDLTRAIVRVGLDRLDFHIDRQHERIRADVALLAGWNLDVLAAQPEHRRRAFRRLLREVQADCRLNDLGTSARDEVDLHDEIGPWPQPPREPVRQERRHLAWSPTKKMTVRINGRRQQQAAVPGRRVLVVELARARRAVDPDVGMMHDAAIARAELESFHVGRRGDWQAEYEDARKIAAVGGDDEGLRKRHGQVWSAKLPSAGPRRGRRQTPRISFRSAGSHPPVDEVDLGVGQVAVTDERILIRFGLPRRHQASARGLRHQAGASSRLCIGQQTEWRGSFRTMAAGASLEHDGCDVGGKRHRRRGRHLTDDCR